MIQHFMIGFSAMGNLLLSRFSPLGNLAVSYTGIFYELSTPVFKTRMPTTRHVTKEAVIDAHWDSTPLVPLFELNIPSPPLQILAETISFFQSIMGMKLTDHKLHLENGFEQDDQHNDKTLTQAEGLVWWTFSQEDGWNLIVPEQDITPGTVNASSICPEDNVAIEVHSHGKMKAYFSRTDNRNENEGFIYGVIGNLDLDLPTVMFRVGSDGHFLPLAPDQIFKIGEHAN